MKYRLIALDLDGTLLRPDQTVGPADVAAIAEAQAAGVRVVPCTGRGWRESAGVLAAVPGLEYGVFNTGAVVVEMADGTAVDLADFEPHLVLELVEFMSDLPDAVLVYQEFGRAGCDYLVCGRGQLSANTRRWFEMNGLRTKEIARPTLDDLHHSLRVGMVAVGQQAFHIERRVTEAFGERVSLHCFAGVPTADKEETVYIVEVFAAGVDKWRGLRWLAEQHGIADHEVAAVGDEINDLAMLRHAGLGVAMGNAVPAAVEAADRQTRHQRDGGVAYAIRQMLAGDW
jgi:hydroxymethylpyrimidine pyrophosphatase-like HAD family hydrolase